MSCCPPAATRSPPVEPPKWMSPPAMIASPAMLSLYRFGADPLTRTSWPSCILWFSGLGFMRQPRHHKAIAGTIRTRGTRMTPPQTTGEMIGEDCLVVVARQARSGPGVVRGAPFFATILHARSTLRPRRNELENGQGHAIRSRHSPLGRDRAPQFSSAVWHRRLRNTPHLRACRRVRVEERSESGGAADDPVRRQHWSA